MRENKTNAAKLDAVEQTRELTGSWASYRKTLQHGKGKFRGDDSGVNGQKGLVIQKPTRPDHYRNDGFF